MTSAGPVLARDLVVSADYGQIYIYSPEVRREDVAGDAYLAALDDATASRRFVGVANGLVDLLTPGQWNWETPMRVEVWVAEPAEDTDEWDHEVDLDLDVPDGQLVFEASGGGPTVATDIPAARYRVRVSGRGFADLGHTGVEGHDAYRLRLWPRTTDQAPELRRSWPGWRDVR
jgi:hypothetical protein